MVIYGQLTTTKHFKVYAPSSLPHPIFFLFFYLFDLLSISLFSFLTYIHIILIIYIYNKFLKTLLVYILFVCCFRDKGGYLNSAKGVAWKNSVIIITLYQSYETSDRIIYVISPKDSICCSPSEFAKTILLSSIYSCAMVSKPTSPSTLGGAHLRPMIEITANTVRIIPGILVPTRSTISVATEEIVSSSCWSGYWEWGEKPS